MHAENNIASDWTKVYETPQSHWLTQFDKKLQGLRSNKLCLETYELFVAVMSTSRSDNVSNATLRLCEAIVAFFTFMQLRNAFCNPKVKLSREHRTSKSC